MMITAHEASVRGGRWMARRAFTLIEVMIVILIIVALTAIAGVAVFSQLRQSKQQLAQVQLNSIKSAMQIFYKDFSRFPSEEEGIAVLWDKSKLETEEDQAKWVRGGYLTDPKPTDPWDKPWEYTVEDVTEEEKEAGIEYKLWSLGEDGEDETGDEVKSWKDAEELDADAAGGDTGGGPTGG